MNSITTEDFSVCFAALPNEIQVQARHAYRLWKANPYHPGLRFKSIRGSPKLPSVRIGRGWRALGKMDNDTMIWFWIGSHGDYDQLIG